MADWTDSAIVLGRDELVVGDHDAYTATKRPFRAWTITPAAQPGVDEPPAGATAMPVKYRKVSYDWGSAFAAVEGPW